MLSNSMGEETKEPFWNKVEIENETQNKRNALSSWNAKRRDPASIQKQVTDCRPVKL